MQFILVDFGHPQLYYYIRL